MSWFTDLTGIEYETPVSVAETLSVSGTTLISSANARRFEIGRLSTPSLADLRKNPIRKKRETRVAEIVSDAQALHLDPANSGAVFQVASQFNLLEMVGPSITPEDGVTRYATDPTQGPACAIACGAGTIYRNYFHPVRGGIGQSKNRQIDCLADLGRLLGNDENTYWVMKNGYALPSAQGLAAIDRVLQEMSDTEWDIARGALRIGVQAGAEVTLGNAGHSVTQAFCSALPVAYTNLGTDKWRRFARLVLEAAYEATLLAAVENTQKSGNNKVFLTMLGGRAFGNKGDWIADAILRALRFVNQSDLDVFLVSYGRPSAIAAQVISSYRNSPLGDGAA